MSQNVLVGMLGQSATNMYGGVTPATYEESGANGFGVRMTSVRQYHNWFTQAFAAASDDETYFKSGHSVVASVSNPNKSPGPGTFTFKLMAAGTYNTDIDAMFDRIFALPFDSAVAGGSTYGGLTQPYVYLILQHEVDRAAVGVQKLYGTDTAADYIAAWQLLWTRCGLRATAAGKPRTRVRFCWDIVGYNVTRADPYYPGAAYVDVIGMDPYTGPTNPASFSSMTSTYWPYVTAKKKPICFPEINYIHNADSTAGQNWWIDAAAQINAQAVKVEFMCLFNPGSNWGSSYGTYAINKNAAQSTAGYATPLIHAGIGTMITNLGGNAIIGAVGQALPLAPTGLTITSSTDGLSAAGGWSANAGGDNVTGWKLYIAPGNVQQGGVLAGTLNTATPRTFTFPSLTPGQTYTGWVSAVNATGEGPLSAPVTFTQKVPSAGNNPAVTSATAVVEGGNAQNVDFSAAATSPLSRPLTYSWSIVQAGQVVDTFNSTSTTRTYSTPGNYTWTLTVADNGTPSLTNTATGSFNIILSATQTPMNGWDLTNFLPGAFVELIGKGLIPILQDQDTKIGNLNTALGEVAELYGTCGQTFDPGLAGSGTCNMASQLTIWAKLKCRTGTISSINTITTQAQIGTGSKLAFCDVNGNVLTVDGSGQSSLAIYSGTALDAWLTAAAGDTTYTLSSSISGIPRGADITIMLFTPATTVTQYPKFIASAAPTNAAIANGNSASPIWGSAAGQTDIVNPTPFGSYAAIARPYFAINA